MKTFYLILTMFFAFIGFIQMLNIFGLSVALITWESANQSHLMTSLLNNLIFFVLSGAILTVTSKKYSSR